MAVIKLTEGNDYDQSFYDMVKGIARKASKELFDRDVDDIEQDLWVKILDTEERRGKQLDQALAARICWDYVSDMQRQDIRTRNHVALSMDSEFLDDLDTDRAGGVDPVGGKRDRGDYDSMLRVHELYDKFPIGSKERTYLDFWGNASGAMPNDRALPKLTPTGQERYSEKALARMLGFAGQDDRQYKRFKRNMQSIIRDYLE